MSFLTLATQENSGVSWEKNRQRGENGRLISAQREALEVHPESQSIINLIRNKKELSLTYKQLSIKIKEKYDIDLTPKFLWHFYTGYLDNSIVFKYTMNNAEKAMNLLDEFIKTSADLQMQRTRNKMDFKLEAQMGKSFPDSYKHSFAIIPLREQVLKLGSAAGYFPEMDFSHNIIRLLNKPDDNSHEFNPKIMQVLKARLSEKDKPPASPYSNPVVAEIVQALFKKSQNNTQENNSVKDDKQAEQSPKNL